MQRSLRFPATFLCALLLAALSHPAEAQMRGFGRKGMGEGPPARGPGPGMVERREGELKATGLAPVFPDSFACAPIASPFGSPTRYDGSFRRDDRFGGLHGGMDLTLNEGTPLLAMAAGTVIAKGEGGQLEGFYLWLMHAPSDTGLPHWVYTKYQHLSELPALNEGERVRAGQAVASSGRTGTIGKHYGPTGYPHLHLSALIGPSGEYQKAGAFGSIIRSGGALLSDPLILYLAKPEDLSSLAALPEDRRRVRVAVVGDGGAVAPEGSKLVWPVSCNSNK